MVTSRAGEESTALEEKANRMLILHMYINSKRRKMEEKREKRRGKREKDGKSTKGRYF